MDEPSTPAAPAPGEAVIRMANQRWSLAAADELTFGRGQQCDIRFGYDPADDYVSRKAGTLIGQPDSVLIRNDSRTQGLILQAFPGPEMAVPPQAMIGTSPYQQLRLIVPGRHGGRYALIIDTRNLHSTPVESAPSATVGPADIIATNPAARVTPRELKLLTALCEPILILAGDDAVAATYQQIAVRVGQRKDSVRACLDQLRVRLTDVDGIPGLRSTEDQEKADYRGSLARWALESRTVTTAHLRLLETFDNG